MQARDYTWLDKTQRRVPPYSKSVARSGWVTSSPSGASRDASHRESSASDTAREKKLYIYMHAACTSRYPSSLHSGKTRLVCRVCTFSYPVLTAVVAGRRLVSVSGWGFHTPPQIRRPVLNVKWLGNGTGTGALMGQPQKSSKMLPNEPSNPLTELGRLTEHLAPTARLC